MALALAKLRALMEAHPNHFSPLNFSAPEAYFCEVFKTRKNLSLRSWARKLGYRSHRTLGMVMSGERSASPELIRRLSKVEKLSDQEERYLKGLVAKRKAQGPLPKSLELELEKIKAPLAGVYVIPELDFRKMYDWFYFVLKQLVFLPSFSLSTKYLEQKLPADFPVRRIKSALETLVSLGLIGYDPATQKFSEIQSQTMTTRDVPSHAVRRFHQQWLVQAGVSIRRDPPTERENLTFTFRGNRKRMAEMKEYLMYMREEFAKKFDDDPAADDVMQMMIHLFPVTRNLEKGS